MSAETATRTAPWWEQFKVDLPAGKHGQVEIRPIVVTEEDARFSNLRAMLHGRGRIVAGTYTGLYRNGGLWMSDTPDEIQDHLPAIYEARSRAKRGDVTAIVNGLGLGMVVKALLGIEGVRHVDVVEIDQDVADLVGPHYAGERCTIHVGDAHDIRWPTGKTWTMAWHDIWQGITTDNAESMTRLKRRYGRRVEWQACWAQAEIDQMKRADRAWSRW